MLNKLYKELIVYISEFISTNKDMINLLLISKYFKEIFYQEGYIKSMTIEDLRMDKELLNNFKNNYTKHNKSINNVNVKFLQNPLQLFNNKPFCKELKFHNCKFFEDIDPIDASRTKILHILQHYYNVKINWKKFPNLEKVVLEVADINFEGIENCENLKIVYYQKLFTDDFNIIKNNIGKIKNLEYFLTDSEIENNTRIISPNIKVFISKNTNNDGIVFEHENKDLITNITNNICTAWWNIELIFNNLNL